MNYKFETHEVYDFHKFHKSDIKGLKRLETNPMNHYLAITNQIKPHVTTYQTGWLKRLETKPMNHYLAITPCSLDFIQRNKLCIKRCKK